MKHFVEWDTIELRVDGSRLAALAREAASAEPSVERLDVSFQNGLLRVEGIVRKFVRIPFSVDITELRASGTEVRVPLHSISAAGFPVPRFLFGLIRSRLPEGLVRYEEPSTLVVSVERFLPDFVSVSLQRVWIIDGGLAITLGRGGADPPPSNLTETINGRDGSV
jgi:hypothetical protein